MKMSDAILAGYATNKGRQCRNRLHADDGAMCVLGAAIKGGLKPSRDEWVPQALKFEKAYGIDPITLHDEGARDRAFPWEHIYGMCRAIGI